MGEGWAPGLCVQSHNHHYKLNSGIILTRGLLGPTPATEEPAALSTPPYPRTPGHRTLRLGEIRLSFISYT